MSRIILLLVVLASLAYVSESTKLVHNMLETYKKIINAQRLPAIHEVVDVNAVKMMINIADEDSHDHCGIPCEAAIREIVGDDGTTWQLFERVVDAIYGDQISDDPFAPQEVHLALTNDISRMKVMWVTMDNLEKPFVDYMPYAEDDWSKAVRTSDVANSTYEVPQKWWPIFNGVIYNSDMTGLAADSKYKYRVGGFDPVNNTMRFSKEFNYKSAPVSNPDRKTVVATGGDHGTFMLFGFLTVNKMIKMYQNQLSDLDFVFIAGDLAYAGLSSAMPHLNIDKEDEFSLVWDLLAVQNEPIAGYFPWMVGNGNHERFYNWSAYTSRYSMPSSANSVQNFWYDFEYGNIRWVQISSEHDLTDGSPQKLYLESALRAAVANRANIPWIVLTIHKPLYCSAEGTPGGYADKIEDLVNAYDVDLIVVGHMHCYERVHPVSKGAVTSLPVEGKFGRPDVYYSTGKGPVHVIQGNTGGMQFESWVQPQPAWSAKRFANGYIPRNKTDAKLVSVEGGVQLSHPDLPQNFNYSNTYGFGVITAWNRTHMQYKAVADTESIVGTDEFWIVKRV